MVFLATDNCSDNVVVEWLSDEWTPGACGGRHLGQDVSSFRHRATTPSVQHIAVVNTVAPAFSTTLGRHPCLWHPGQTQRLPPKMPVET